MGNQDVTEADVLDYLVQMGMRDEPPEGYYSMSQLYERARQINPDLRKEAFRARIRKQGEEGNIDVIRIGSRIYYGKGET